MKVACSVVCLAVLLALARSALALNYMKMWGPPENGEPSRFDVEVASPYEQALLKKIQASMEASRDGAWPIGEDVPAKRQIRYHQCYFNPISCFRKRK